MNEVDPEPSGLGKLYKGTGSDEYNAWWMDHVKKRAPKISGGDDYLCSGRVRYCRAASCTSSVRVLQLAAVISPAWRSSCKLAPTRVARRITLQGRDMVCSGLLREVRTKAILSKHCKDLVISHALREFGMRRRTLPSLVWRARSLVNVFCSGGVPDGDSMVGGKQEERC